MKHYFNLGMILTALASMNSLIDNTWANQEIPLKSPPNPPHESAVRFQSEKVFIADSKKTKTQIKDGLIIGGDRAIDQVVIKDIRFSSQAGFERIVIDLEGTRNGETMAIPRPPYFQIEVSPAQKRIGVSVWGRPELRFNARKVHAVFKKSALLKGISLLPKIEDDFWTFALPIKSDTTVEVFELTQPVRIIMDISKKKS